MVLDETNGAVLIKVEQVNDNLFLILLGIKPNEKCMDKLREDE